MSKIAEAKLRLFVSAVVLIFTIVALFSINGTLAWFANNEKVTADGLEISVSAPENIVKNIEYFNIASISVSDGKNNYQFDATTSYDTGKLGVYSPLTGERQILIKVTLQDNVDRVTVTANTSSQEYPVYDGAIINKDTPIGLSSVIHLCVFNNLVVENGEYEVVGSIMESNATSFATVTTNSNSLQPDVSYTTDITMYSTASGGDDNELYIFIDYYEDSVDYVIDYINHIIMGADPNDNSYISGEEVQFNGDFSINISRISE